MYYIIIHCFFANILCLVKLEYQWSNKKAERSLLTI